METKDTGTINVNKQNKFKIKCYKFYSPELERNLMAHEDVDTKNCSSVSDEITGYRLFTLHQSIGSLKQEHIQERLDKFIKHFTIEGIKKEFERVEELLRSSAEARGKKK